MQSTDETYTGRRLLQCPTQNKGTAFSEKERKGLKLEGLLPAHVSSIEEQIARRYLYFQQKQSRLDKYQFLADLQNRNEVLFYRFILEHVEEVLPCIYTPTVGDVSLDYSLYYQESRGMFLSYAMKGRLEEILSNWKYDDVRTIVVTDGERILGLGDVGVGGMTIPIGKLSLYISFGGLDPRTTLPIILDTGTNNKKLLEDPLYLGLHQPRVSPEQLYEFVEEFVQAVKKLFPQALLQWEDFAGENARVLLSRYKDRICSFNDDIQGTAAVVLSGLLAAVKKKKSTLAQEKFAIFGGGAAGMGTAEIIVDYLVQKGMSVEEARGRIYIVGRRGLVHDGLDKVVGHQKDFARNANEVAFWAEEDEETIRLLDVVEKGEITVLIGASAQKDAFDKKIVEAMCQNTDNPIIFPLSNPNTKCEAHPDDLIPWSKGSAIVATGSPYKPVEYEGKSYAIGQCNNVYIFPAFGLAASSVSTKKITQNMFLAAAEALSEKTNGGLFPAFSQLRDVTKFVAKRVIEQAIKDGEAEKPKESIQACIDKTTWDPTY